MNFILGTKEKMTQIFTEQGEAIPVTVVQAGPCRITQVKTTDKDGYVAVQVGLGRKKSLVKSLLGHLHDLPTYRWLREFRVISGEASGFERGQEIGVETFSVGDKVKVVGESKGKGFQGVVRRHGFHGSPASHGHKDQERMPGSIGATDAAHVFKGRKMPGRMGANQVTVSNLEIVNIDEAKNLLYLKGAVPGPRSGFLKIVGTGDLKFREIKQEKEVKPVIKENQVKEPNDDVQVKENPIEEKIVETVVPETNIQQPVGDLESKTEVLSVDPKAEVEKDNKIEK